jgi:hypothetical protein
LKEEDVQIITDLRNESNEWALYNR